MMLKWYNLNVFWIGIGLIGVFASCTSEVLPKPKARLRLSYPSPVYESIETECGYRYEKNTIAIVKSVNAKKDCWYNLEYPTLKAVIYLSYYQVQNNLDSLLIDAQNLTQEHVVKADEIVQEPYSNLETNVHGMFYSVSGDAASQAQFYVTDSTRHFVSGSVYFKARPNYDSILPAAHYLRHDIRHFMETLRWKE